MKVTAQLSTGIKLVDDVFAHQQPNPSLVVYCPQNSVRLRRISLEGPKGLVASSTMSNQDGGYSP